MAGLLRALFKRIQDGATELGDALSEDRVERGLDQDIQTIDLHLHRLRNDAAAMKAQRIAKEDRVKKAKADVAAIEGEIAALLARRRSAQAREHATRAVAMQADQRVLQQECKELKDKEVEFAKLIPQFEQQLRRAKHQLGMLRAASGIQRAQTLVARLQPGPQTYPESAQVSAQRARQRTASDGPEKVAAPSPSAGRRKPAASDVSVDVEALMDRLSKHPPVAARRTTRKPR